MSSNKDLDKLNKDLFNAIAEKKYDKVLSAVEKGGEC
jgi:hypothetical protein